MKYNIPKLRNGGWASLTPVLPEQEATAATPSSGSKNTKHNISSILTDSVFEDLMGKGLTNDVISFADQLSKIESGSSDNMFPYTQSNNRVMAIKLMGKINELKQSKSAFDDAVKTATTAGGYGEVAVNNDMVYGKDAKGNVSAINVDDYAKHKDKYRLLTVAELLNERQLNPKLVGQNSIFDVANNAIGLEKITNHLKDMISAFGTEETHSENFYSKEQAMTQGNSLVNQIAKAGNKPTAAEKSALETLNQIVSTPGSYYKVTSENSSERNHIDKALNYLWKTMGVQAQQKLKATAAINGESDPKQFIVEMLTTNTSVKTTMNIAPEELPGAAATAAAAGKNEYGLTQFQMFHKDKLMTPNNTFAVNDPVMGSLFRGVIGGVSPIILPNGKSVGMTTVGNVLSAGYNQFLKGDQVYFGNKKVSPYELNNIQYDGQDAVKVYMPVDNSGKPDYEGLAKFKDLYAIYEANKDHWTTSQAENHFYKNGGYRIKIDEQYEDGKRIKVIRDNAYVKPFLVMYGITNNATDLIDNNENWLSKITSEEEKSLLPRLKAAWTVGTGKNAKDMTPNSWGPETYYRGMVAIPYRDAAAATVDAMVGHGPRDKSASLLDVQRNLNFSSNQPLNTNTSVLSLN